MTTPIAVAIVHGIGNQRENFADEFMMLLANRFSKVVNNANAELIFEPVFWAQHLQDIEAELWRRVTANDLPLGWKNTREIVMLQFVGDGIAYQPSLTRRDIYDLIHGVFADALHQLAIRAGETAPLCIIAHSLGTVIASNALYDLQEDRNRPADHRLISDSVRKRIGAAPLEWGETLTNLYIMGSPLAMWALRFEDFGQPIKMPHPKLHDHYPDVTPEWINYFDKDDVIGFPIKTLNAAYQQTVTADVEINVGRPPGSWTPYSHLNYWKDDKLITRIATSLAATWRQVNKQPELT